MISFKDYINSINVKFKKFEGKEVFLGRKNADGVIYFTSERFRVKKVENAIPPFFVGMVVLDDDTHLEFNDCHSIWEAPSKEKMDRNRELDKEIRNKWH